MVVFLLHIGHSLRSQNPSLSNKLFVIHSSVKPWWMKSRPLEIIILGHSPIFFITNNPLDANGYVIYKIKYNFDGFIKWYKSHLVAKVYNQKEGLDYWEIFSPIAKLVTICVLLAVAAIHSSIGCQQCLFIWRLRRRGLCANTSWFFSTGGDVSF